MIELFRYIEQEFVVPAATDSIDVSNESDFQNKLRDEIQNNQDPDSIRNLVDSFLLDNFSSPVADPFQLGSSYLALCSQLPNLPSPDNDTVNELISKIFGSDAEQLIGSSSFLSDKELLNDSIVAVKIVTGFNRVNATDLVKMRQAVAFVEDFAVGKFINITSETIKKNLSRPTKIPQVFFKSLIPSSKTAPTESTRDSTNDVTSRQIAELNDQHAALKSVYDTIMGLQPDQFELKQVTVSTAQPMKAINEIGKRGRSPVVTQRLNSAVPVFLSIPQKIHEGLDDNHRQTLAKLGIDITSSPVTSVLDTVKKKWIDVSRQLLPYQVPGPAKVYRIGIHLFAIQEKPVATNVEVAAGPAPDFSHAITRPVGVGNLQVVRQELIGYETGDISHIENVLEGELMRRSTRREETNELTITQETDTTQTEERDQQSTDRNELATETQKEAGKQSVSSQDQTTTTDYGKLVENSKTNYARSVTDRAVNSLTQMVKQQRIQREKKSFTENALHELDNRQSTKKIRGIYQWVDKKYKNRIINYGKRLLYDVVVPEPAAFLIDSLKKAVQPENFQLNKPTDPSINPPDLNAANYWFYAMRYGVTGSITPPPDEFIQTVAKTDALNAKTFGTDGLYYAAFKIPVAVDYKAVSGYVQQTNLCFKKGSTQNRNLEFYIGEYNYFRFCKSPTGDPADESALNRSFNMNGETGEIPVTMNCCEDIIQFNYAIGINCQRTDKALEQWQLKTHAAIMAGYQRQLADYQDKLNQYQAAVRSQMALAQNFAHDPSVEEQELKKAFIYLLLSEHFGKAYLPTPDPIALPPDPVYIKNWGAMVAFFERAFEWENIMYTYYPYFWGRQTRWGELILIQDTDPQFEAFLKAGAARVVIPTRPGFEAALAHYQETGDIWMGEEIPDMFSDLYVSIIEEIKSRNFALGDEICVAEWDVKLPTTLVMLKEDEVLPEWKPTVDCKPSVTP